jgi:general secretion pathway protein A
VNHKMLALYGLKWNPFTPNVPTEALHVVFRRGKRTPLEG